MPATGVHHVDLAVADLERSLVFYRELLGPLGWSEEIRYPTYRGTEDVVYLTRGDVRNGGIGLRTADGGKYRYYDIGVEHIAFEVVGREEVEEAHARCVASGANVHFPPEEDQTAWTSRKAKAPQQVGRSRVQGGEICVLRGTGLRDIAIYGGGRPVLKLGKDSTNTCPACV